MTRSSSPARNTPIPMTASSTSAERRSIPRSVVAVAVVPGGPARPPASAQAGRRPRTAQARAERRMTPFASGSTDRAQPFAQRVTRRRGQRRDVGRGRAGAPEERRPQVVEVLEDRRDLDGPGLDAREPGGGEGGRQRAGCGGREADALIETGRRRVERDGGVPEPAEELHPVRVVPHVTGDRSAWSRDPPRLIERRRRGPGTKLRTSPETTASTRVVQTGRPGVADRNVARWSVTAALACATNASDGSTPATELGRAAVEDRAGQGAGAAAHVQPVGAGRDPQPVQEEGCHEPAPAADVRLVVAPARPSIVAAGHMWSLPGAPPIVAVRSIRTEAATTA